MLNAVAIRVALGLGSAMLGVILVALPRLASPPDATFQLICWFAAVVPFSGAAYFAIHGVVEYTYLQRLLGKESRPSD